jgi:hypothetical protein
MRPKATRADAIWFATLQSALVTLLGVLLVLRFRDFWPGALLGLAVFAFGCWAVFMARRFAKAERNERPRD